MITLLTVFGIGGEGTSIKKKEARFSGPYPEFSIGIFQNGPNPWTGQAMLCCKYGELLPVVAGEPITTEPEVALFVFNDSGDDAR